MSQTSQDQPNFFPLWLVQQVKKYFLLYGIICAVFGGEMPLAQAQQANEPESRMVFAISSQPLSSAIVEFGNVTGWQVGYAGSVNGNLMTRTVSGRLTPTQALQQMILGLGITVEFTGGKAAVLFGLEEVGASDSPYSGPALAQDETILVQGEKGVKGPYREPGAKAYISGEDIDHYRGSNAADIFRGTAGVMSADGRNSGNGIDVNIRGMQGMGRVAVTIDGAMNNTTIHQGYQGISNRSFIDPDLIAGVDIQKGSDPSSRGIAGSVAMRTVETRDIVKPGKNWGLRLKLEAGTNTASPVPGSKGGYNVDNNPTFPTNTIFLPTSSPFYPTPLPRPFKWVGEAPWPDIVQPSLVSSDKATLNRPDLLDLTQGSGSLVAAYQNDNFEFLAAGAHRQRGNYFAGEEGGAYIENMGRQPYCPNGNCSAGAYYNEFYKLQGLANYRPGEQVLNTELESTSLLLKGGYRFGDGHMAQLSYNGFMSEAGDRLASRLNSTNVQAVQQAQTIRSELDTFTFKHVWQPENNPLLNLKTNAWYTLLERRNPIRFGWGNPPKPEEIGLARDFRTGTDNISYGLKINNKSFLETGFGDLDLSYGLSYLHEETTPSEYSRILEGSFNMRDGERDEYATFVNANFKVTDWLDLSAGLRYQQFKSLDRNEPAAVANPQEYTENGWSPSIGLTVTPLENAQFYVKYSSTQRMPSLFESLTGFSATTNPALKSERSNNWEIGANVTGDDMLFSDDSGMVKLGYFNWDIDSYVSRQWGIYPGTSVFSMFAYNTDRAKFSGLELDARYEWAGFSADLAANYYLNVEFCKTADTCENSSLYADYATNQIPPEYTISLDLQQKLLNDSLTIGGRMEHIGQRAIEHDPVTAAGASAFITLTEWNPHTLFDIYADYDFNDYLSASVRVQNLTDEYYIDPLSLVSQPGPGRTIYIGANVSF